MRRVFMGGDPSIALATVMSLALTLSKPGKPRQLTIKESVAREKRNERQRWNDEVERRKADKKAAKGSDK